MKRKMVVLVTVLILGIGIMVTIDHFHPFIADAVMDVRYEKIGVINEYTLYIDTTKDSCAEALETIYQDETHVYYFSCIQSGFYRLVSSEETIGLREAVEKNKVSILELRILIPEILMNPVEHPIETTPIVDLARKGIVELGKIGDYTLYEDTSAEFCAMALETIYEDDEYIYYFSCMLSGNYLLVSETESIGIIKALKEQKVTIQDLGKLIPGILVRPKEDK